MSGNAPGDPSMRCSFCDKTQADVRKLIAGPAAFICNECVDVCNDMIRAESRQNEGEPAPAPPTSDWRTALVTCRLCGQDLLWEQALVVPDRGHLCPGCSGEVEAALGAEGHQLTASALRTERLRLRPWRASDREPFAALNADPRVMAYFPAVLTRAESDRSADIIQAQIEQLGWGLWAVEISGVTPFAGFVGLAQPRFDAHFTPCTEIGWRLAAEFWGRGYATEGAQAALAYAFESLELDEIVAFTAEGNRASRRVMERLGMTHKPADDFDHPSLPAGHLLRPHVLYRKTNTT